MTQVASGSTRHVSIPDSQRGPAAQIQPSLHPSLQQHDPNEQNTALWITGLPPTVTPRELLAQIRGAGKVFSLAILPVRYDRHGNVHARTAAASLAFFSPDGARALIQQQQNQRPLVVGGRMASVRYNNRRGDPCHDEGSRVLIIKGDPQIVRYGFLKVFFATREILYETDRRYYSAVDGESRIEWRFASYLGQARRAYDHLKRTYADRVSVEYGRDPCEAA
ncbi:hypothetical protein F5B20DRAFT_409338 [Whalleya microplaca]|nr:hypothetical protein F5B20DRAFT_409338 [Whalleya microplaca]